jgi:microcystin-dependent protein
MKIKAQLPINLSASLQTTRWKAILDQTIKQGNELVDKVDTLIQNQASTVPSGTVVMFAGSTAPGGWLLCDGAVVEKADYSSLFDQIGTTYNTGTEGPSQFRLPNTQGIFVRGAGTQTISGQSYSGTLGNKQVDNFESHNHGGSTGSTSLTYQPLVNYGFGGASALTATGSTSHSHSIASSGSGTETYPANIVFNYIIKT